MHLEAYNKQGENQLIFPAQNQASYPLQLKWKQKLKLARLLYSVPISLLRDLPLGSYCNLPWSQSIHCWLKYITNRSTYFGEHRV